MPQTRTAHLPKNPASPRYFPYVTRQEQPRRFQHNFIRYSLLYLSFFGCLDDFVTRITARQKAFYSVFKQEGQCTSRDGETPDSRYKNEKINPTTPLSVTDATQL